MASLLAPTVPSLPKPQKTHCVTESSKMLRGRPRGNDKLVTSSVMPTVNGRWMSFSSLRSMLVITAWTMRGVKSLEPNPNRPPATTTLPRPFCMRLVHTSKYNGSPWLPPSRVRSMTAIRVTDLGIRSTNALPFQGRNIRIPMTHVVSLFKCSRVLLQTANPEPMIKMATRGSVVP